MYLFSFAFALLVFARYNIVGLSSLNLLHGFTVHTTYIACLCVAPNKTSLNHISTVVCNLVVIYIDE